MPHFLFFFLFLFSFRFALHIFSVFGWGPLQPRAGRGGGGPTELLSSAQKMAAGGEGKMAGGALVAVQRQSEARARSRVEDAGRAAARFVGSHGRTLVETAGLALLGAGLTTGVLRYMERAADTAVAWDISVGVLPWPDNAKVKESSRRLRYVSALHKAAAARGGRRVDWINVTAQGDTPRVFYCFAPAFYRDLENAEKFLGKGGGRGLLVIVGNGISEFDQPGHVIDAVPRRIYDKFDVAVAGMAKEGEAGFPVGQYYVVNALARLVTRTVRVIVGWEEDTGAYALETIKAEESALSRTGYTLIYGAEEAAAKAAANARGPTRPTLGSWDQSLELFAPRVMFCSAETDVGACNNFFGKGKGRALLVIVRDAIGQGASQPPDLPRFNDGRVNVVASHEDVKGAVRRLILGDALAAHLAKTVEEEGVGTPAAPASPVYATKYSAGYGRAGTGAAVRGFV